MIRTLWKRRRLLAGPLLLAYLLGGLQLPALEGLHLLAHLGEDLARQMERHSLHAHPHTHHHPLLEWLAASTADEEEHPRPLPDTEPRKFPQLLTPLPLWSSVVPGSLPPITSICRPAPIFPSVPSPPPRG